ncbi:MAG: substrate-binding domain-containing protein [Anaerolineae bacterium]|nr:substrate-binding domain-containing protein [Anaerolineae bacterium]
MQNGRSRKKKRIKRQNKRPTIGFLIVNTTRGWEQLQWLGVVDAARAQDVNLICFPGGELRGPYGFTAQANVLYNLVSAERVDGIVLWQAGFDNYVNADEVAEFCAQYQLPVVTVEDTVVGVPGVLMDNYQAMKELMLHLIEGHGYRRIAFIKHLSQSHFGFEERYRAYADTLAQHGISGETNLISPPFGPEDPASLAKLARWLQAERIAECDAVVVHSDQSALFALPVLQSSGIRVPADLTLTGFDDIAESGFVTPPLTTVRPPFYEMGWKAVEIMSALLAGEKVPQQVVLPSKLVIRQSCGCLNPVVEQAAAGPVLVTNETFKTVVSTGREELISEMVQAIGTSGGDQTSAWAEQLLDAFVATLGAKMEGESPATFLSTLDEVLRQVIAADGDAALWQNGLLVLRRFLLPCLSNNETETSYLERAEEVWGQAAIMIGEAARRTRLNRRLQAERQAQTLREIGQALMTTFDVTESVEVLAQDLPRLGIPSCYLSLYENPAVPAEWSKLLLAYSQKGRLELDSAGQRFPSRQLVPEAILRERNNQTEQPYRLIAEPLYFRDNQLGFVLFEVGPREGVIYDALQTEISSALQGALLVEKRRQAEKAMLKRATELELVAQVSAAAAAVLDATELLERVANLTKDSFGLYHAHIYLLDEARQSLELVAGAGTVGQQMVAEGWRIPYNHEQSVVARAARTRRGIVVNDVLADSNWLPNVLLPDTQSELAVPLMTSEKVLGVLDVQADEVGHFTEDDIRTQSTLAAQVAVALENARLFEEGQQSLAFIQRLYQTAQQLTSAGDLSEILATVVKVGPEELVNRALLGDFEYDKNGELSAVVIRANWPDGQEQSPVLVGTRYQRSMHPVISQFLGSAPKIFKDIQHDAQFDEGMRRVFGQLNARDLGVLPLKIGPRQTGVLWLLTDEARQLHPEDIRPHVSLMNQMAIAVENQRLLMEMNAALAEVERTQRDYTAQTWETYWTRHGGQTSYQKVKEEITSPEGILSAGVAQEIPPRFAGLANGDKTKQPLLKEEKIGSSLVFPLTVRDQVIGVLGLQDTAERAWTPEESAIVEAISEQLAQAMENLRLIDETRQRAWREAKINEMSEKIRGAQSLAEALQIAVKEVGLSLKVPQTAGQVRISE